MIRYPLFSLALALPVVLLFGCDWSSSGSGGGYNTSQGAGVSINLSGVYRGELGGGAAVARTSRGRITTLTLSQTGNKLDVIDNQGSRYTGAVGSPRLVAEPRADGSYPAGAELTQGQVSFSGKDNVSGKEIQFAGIVHVVAVTDIRGNTSETTTTSGSANNSEKVVNDGTNTTRTSTTVQGNQVTTTTVVINNQTGSTISSNQTTETIGTVFSQFQITGANSQYRLEGTWVENDGVTSGVQARSAGTSGLIQAPTPAAP